MERRLAAILVADVVGYSRLMGEDEVGMCAIIKLSERRFKVPLPGATRTINPSPCTLQMCHERSSVHSVGYALQSNFCGPDHNGISIDHSG